MKETQKKYPSPITLRLTQNERIQLEKDAGDLSLSAHIRWCVLKATPRKNTPVKDQEALSRVLGQLGQSRIANNLNQLAKEAHSGTLLLDEETLNKIEAAYSHICSMRKSLIAALGLREASHK